MVKTKSIIVLTLTVLLLSCQKNRSFIISCDSVEYCYSRSHIPMPNLVFYFKIVNKTDSTFFFVSRFSEFDTATMSTMYLKLNTERKADSIPIYVSPQFGLSEPDTKTRFVGYIERDYVLCYSKGENVEKNFLVWANLVKSGTIVYEPNNKDVKEYQGKTYPSEKLKAFNKKVLINKENVRFKLK
jgi:hypothetical protein